MNKPGHLLVSFWCALIVVLVWSGDPRPAPAYEFNPQGFEVPKLYGAEKYGDEMIDFDKAVPGAETRLEKFNTPDGGRVWRLSHNGNIFSYIVDHDRQDPMDYELVDMDGSGAFEIRQDPYGMYPLPLWTFKLRQAPDDSPWRGLASLSQDKAAKGPTTNEMISALAPKSVLLDQSKPSKLVLKINFHYDSDRLTSEAMTVLDQLGPALTSASLSGSRFMIEGHTDGHGSDEYNQKLSTRRAQSVARYLENRFQIDSSRLEPVGRGKSQLQDPAHPFDGVNRRVEIINLGQNRPAT